ncbi:MAG: efflux RND transporter permease subunit, partial [Bdellovibrionota bacterium]
MDRVIRYFAENGRITYLLTFLVLIAGLIGVFSLKRESFPTVDFATITVETTYVGASPDEVEDLITIPLEDELRTVDGFDKVMSVSLAGQSEITIQVELDGYDSDSVMDDAQRAIQRAKLPADLQDQPRVIRVNSGEIPVFEIGLIGPANGGARDRLAEDLQNLFEDVDGVANVRFNGYNAREFKVNVDQQKARTLQVSLSEINRALSDQLRDIPGGYVKADGGEWLVRVKGKSESANRIENIIVRGTFEGGEVRVGDIAKVVDGTAEPEIITRLNGESATLLTVTKQGQADTITLVDKLKVELEKFNKKIPEGYSAVIYTNEAVRVEADLGIVQFNAVLGLALILIVLLILLPGTIGLTASISLPLTIFAMTFGMHLMGLTFNSITMIAAVIVLGLLVDNSAVVAEGYARQRALGLNPTEASIKAASLFFVPILATVLCNFAGFAPMLVTTGIMGQFIYSIPVVITIALAFSIVETFILLPARLKLTLHRTIPKVSQEDAFDDGWFGKIQRRFHKIVIALLRRKYLTLGTISLIFISSIFVSAFLNRFELFPTDVAEYYTGRFEIELGSTVEKTEEVSQKLSDEVLKRLKDNGIKYNAVVSFSGVSRIDLFDPQGRRAHNVGFVLITIPEDVSMEISSKWLVGILKDITTPEIKSIRWQELVNGPPVGRPLNLIFRSSSDEQLQGMVNEFKTEIAKIPGTEGIEDDRFRTARELQLNLNQDLLRRAGLSVSQVGEAVRTALQGEIVSKLNMRAREVLIRVQYESSDRTKLTNVANISIPTQDGGYMRLTNLAEIKEVPGPLVRKRYDYHKSVTVSADVKEPLTSLAINAKSREIIAQLKTKYPDVSFFAGGEEENTQESFASLMQALLISIIAILGILVVVYRSYGQSFLVLSTIPLGLAGVSYVFWIAGIPLSFMA